VNRCGLWEARAGWYIKSVMIGFRKAKWFPWLSALLLAAWIPVQASGCCKLSFLLGLMPIAEAASEAAPMAADHSCCKKSQSAPEPAEAESGAEPFTSCGNTDKGCCIQGAPASVDGIASTPVSPSLVVRLSLLPASGESVAAPASRSASSLRIASGPPLYLAQHRLLI
jgi:hypothetical protein